MSKTKGEYISEVLKIDKNIKEIDSAVPLYIRRDLDDLGLPVREYVWAYYSSGHYGLLNIVSH